MMHLLYRRYSRSGYAPQLFYIVMALGFAGLAVFSAVRGSWLIAAIAIVMCGVTVAGSQLLPRLSITDLAASSEKEDNDE